MDKRNHLLKKLVVKGKKKSPGNGPVKVSIKYQVEQEMDRRRDEGEWEPANLNTFLLFTSKYFFNNSDWNVDVQGERNYSRYDNSSLLVENANSPLSDGENTQSTDNFGAQSTDNNGYGRFAKLGNGKNNITTEMNPFDGIESVSIIEDPASILRIDPKIEDPSRVVIVLIHKNKKNIKEPTSIRNTYFEGYANVKEFFNPKYDKVILPDEKDYRRTLYWNPDVKTDTNGKATISFYNNGSCKAMNVSAETVTEEGEIGAMYK